MDFLVKRASIRKYNDAFLKVRFPPGPAYDLMNIDDEGKLDQLSFVARCRGSGFVAEQVQTEPPIPADRIISGGQLPACHRKDAPIVLSGSWLGILRISQVAPVPPYDMTLFVQRASRHLYERTFLRVHIPGSLRQELRRAGLSSSPRIGAPVGIVAGCLGPRFVARHVTTNPRG